ncbi:MAG TPA: branched-chain amino acid ABC transporter permease [Candidatus Baltobacteraceae bacterium]|nr:branched-chain amino acid ABC transporter permease [Candidatus Baltobacteraceae bacterium]
MHELLAQLVNGISLGGIYALIAIGYTMVYGIVELINFAHGDVYTLGSFVALAIFGALGVSGELHGVALALDVALALAGAAICCGLIGMLIERLAYRRLRNAPRLAPLTTAIGVSFILENAMQAWKGAAPIPFPAVMPNPTLTFGPLAITVQQLVVVVLAVVAMVALHLFVQNTRTGKAMRAVAQDRQAAALMGINVDSTIAITFLVAGVLAGVGGFVSGVYYQSTWFLNGFGAGLKAFTAAVLGGIGNLPGAMLGGFLIGIIESLATWKLGGQWSNVTVFAILILVLVVRPSGLLGAQVAEKV